MSRYLITTAFENTWPDDLSEPVIFLGEWCKLYSRQHIWSIMDYEVLPYHWDDHKKLSSDTQYLNNLYEEILSELSNCLNQLHGVNHSERYWRIVIGMWLFAFIHVLYDRYQSILSCTRSGEIKITKINRSSRYQSVPIDFSHFGKLSTEDDEYNYFLYSQIIEDINIIPFEYSDIDAKNSIYKSATPNLETKPLSIKKTLRRFLNWIIKKYNKIIFVEVGFSAKDVSQLLSSLKQMSNWIAPTVNLPELKIKPILRDKIRFDSSDDSFKIFLLRMIRDQIPKIYVEGFQEFNKIVLNTYPKCPKVIFNDTAFYANEPFKFWAAYNVDSGGKLLGNQHGGLYGTDRLRTFENHQNKIYDIFYTWGWESDIYQNTKSLPVIKFNWVKNKVNSYNEGRLLMMSSCIPIYGNVPEFRLSSSSGYHLYLKEQFRFAKVLTKKNRKLLLVRLYPHDYRQSQKGLWNKELPEVECASGDEWRINHFNDSRLCICTYNGTVFLESFIYDFPTIIYFNPLHCELRLSAKPYFEELRRVGIFFDKPEDAAKKVNEIAEDPKLWWEQDEIQAAKNSFCNQFARTSNNWLQEWVPELNKSISQLA